MGIVTGGGSGHLPLFLGYVGYGLADGVAVGDVFASPSSEQILEATRAVHGGTGVLYLYGNYGGDVMNFDLAAELAMAEGIETSTVLGADDVASAPAGSESRRRGVAGITFLYKVAGARAEEGASLDEVVARRGAGGGRPAVHGRRPVALHRARRRRTDLQLAGRGNGDRDGHPRRARGAARRRSSRQSRSPTSWSSRIISRPAVQSGDEVAVFVNGLGATPREELYVLFRSVHAALASSGMTVRRTWVGEYATSLEMAGRLGVRPEAGRRAPEAAGRPVRVTVRGEAVAAVAPTALVIALSAAADARRRLGRPSSTAWTATPVTATSGITMSQAAQALREVLARSEEQSVAPAAFQLRGGHRPERPVHQRDPRRHRLSAGRQGAGRASPDNDGGSPRAGVRRRHGGDPGPGEGGSGRPDPGRRPGRRLQQPAVYRSLRV